MKRWDAGTLLVMAGMVWLIGHHLVAFGAIAGGLVLAGRAERGRRPGADSETELGVSVDAEVTPADPVTGSVQVTLAATRDDWSGRSDSAPTGTDRRRIEVTGNREFGSRDITVTADELAALTSASVHSTRYELSRSGFTTRQSPVTDFRDRACSGPVTS